VEKPAKPAAGKGKGKGNATSIGIAERSQAKQKPKRKPQPKQTPALLDRFLSSGRKWNSRDGERKEATFLPTTENRHDLAAVLYANRQRRAWKCLQYRCVCGKTPAYPQRQMCKSRFFAG
jgi:hypothetical protein